MSPTSVRELSTEEYPLWDAFVERAAGGSIYSTTRYLQALCAATGAAFRVLAAFRGTELYGGVALYETTSCWGIAVENRLLLYYNGFVLKDSLSTYPADRTAEANATLSALEDALRDRAFGRISLHHRPPLADLRVLQRRGWLLTPAYSYVVPLTNLTDSFARVDKNLRRLMRRAEDERMTVTEDADFDSFFALHEAVHLRKEAPLYLPRPIFQTFVTRLLHEKLGTLFQARLSDGRAVATQLVLLGNHPISHTVCAGSHVDGLKNGATAYLRWKAFEALAAKGYRGNDLTDATLNPVTKFKSELGGDLELSLVTSRPESLAFRCQNLLQAASMIGVGGRVGMTGRRPHAD